MTQPTATTSVTLARPNCVTGDPFALYPLDDDIAHPTVRIRLRVESDGRCVYDEVNPAGVQYFGLTKGELVGYTPQEAVCPDVARELDALHRRCIEKRQTLSYYRTRTYPDRDRTFSVMMRPVIEEGAVRAIEVVAYDITDSAEAA